MTLFHNAGTEDNVRTVAHQLAFRSEAYSLTFVTAGEALQQDDSVLSNAGPASGNRIPEVNDRFS